MTSDKTMDLAQLHLGGFLSFPDVTTIGFWLYLGGLQGGIPGIQHLWSGKSADTKSSDQEAILVIPISFFKLFLLFIRHKLLVT